MSLVCVSAGLPTLAHVLVVVPARDEEELLERCLRGIGRASGRLADERHPEVRCHTVVVLDSCADGSAAVAAAHDCSRLEVRFASVGAARAAGVAAGRSMAAHADPRRVWVASTDADSEVPDDWLTAHVGRADEGADLVLGAVRPDPAAASSAVLSAWQTRDRALDHGQRVHGANLGVRLSAYDRVGGFPPVPEHEDVALVDALRRAGVNEAACPSVLTSSRSLGRAPGGFAGYLRELSAAITTGALRDVPPTG